MADNDYANILIIQDEWDGGIEDILTQEISNGDIAYDLVTTPDEAMSLLGDARYDLILTDPFIVEKDDEILPGVLPFIEACAKKLPDARVFVLALESSLSTEVIEQLDLNNVAGIFDEPIDSEAVTDIANAVADIA